MSSCVIASEARQSLCCLTMGLPRHLDVIVIPRNDSL